MIVHDVIVRKSVQTMKSSLIPTSQTKLLISTAQCCTWVLGIYPTPSPVPVVIWAQCGTNTFCQKGFVDFRFSLVAIDQSQSGRFGILYFLIRCLIILQQGISLQVPYTVFALLHYTVLTSNFVAASYSTTYWRFDLTTMKSFVVALVQYVNENFRICTKMEKKRRSGSFWSEHILLAGREFWFFQRTSLFVTKFVCYSNYRIRDRSLLSQ